MKKVAAILIMAILLITASSCNIIYDDNIAPTEGIRVYDVDYIEKYKDTLNVMFDNEWTLISAEDKYEEHEPVCVHVDTRPEQFIEWTIEYSDGNGDVRLFVFDNRRSLSWQIERYITDYIPAYYKENFYDVYTKDFPLAGSSYVFCFFVRMSSYTSYDAVRDIDETTKKYQSLLDTPEGAICLAKLTPANFFEMCPVYLSISVGLSGDSSYGQSFEENVIKQTEDMVEIMNEFANNRLNAQVDAGYHEIVNMYDGNRDRRWAFLQGERANTFDDRAIFESYKGVFW